MLSSPVLAYLYIFFVNPSTSDLYISRNTLWEFFGLFASIHSGVTGLVIGSEAVHDTFGLHADDIGF